MLNLHHHVCNMVDRATLHYVSSTFPEINDKLIHTTNKDNVPNTDFVFRFMQFGCLSDPVTGWHKVRELASGAHR